MSLDAGPEAVVVRDARARWALSPPMDEPAIPAHSHKPEHNPPGVNDKRARRGRPRPLVRASVRQ